MAIDIRLETDPAKAFAPDSGWDALLENSDADTIFLSARWLSAAHETYDSDRAFLAATLLDGGLPKAQVAMSHDGRSGRFVGDGPSDYLDFVVARSCEPVAATLYVNMLLDSLRAKAPGLRRLRLRNIRAGSPTATALQVNGRWRAVALRSTIAPAMAMSQADQAIKKKSLKRHENGLAKLGNLEAATTDDPAKIEPKLEEFFEQHIERWRPTPFPSQFLEQRNRDFFRRLVQTFAAPGAPRWLRFTELRLDGRLIASHFGACRSGVFTWYKPTFAIDLRDHSPGEVLLKRLIERAIEERAEWFDFTIGDEAFKERFATVAPRITDWLVTTSLLERSFVQARLAIKSTLKRWLKRGPGKLDRA